MLEPFGTVLVIVDDPTYSSHVVQTIRVENLVAETFTAAQDALEFLDDTISHTNSPDEVAEAVVCIVVDEGLSGMDGISFTKRLQDRKIEVPVIWLTQVTEPTKLQNIIMQAKFMGCRLVNMGDIERRLTGAIKDATREHQSSLFRAETLGRHQELTDKIEALGQLIADSLPTQDACVAAAREVATTVARTEAQAAVAAFTLGRLWDLVARNRWTKRLAPLVMGLAATLGWFLLDLRWNVYANGRDVTKLLKQSVPVVTASPRAAQPPTP